MNKKVDLEMIGFVSFLYEISKLVDEDHVLTKKYIADTVGWSEEKVSNKLEELVRNGVFEANIIEG